ncbi:hypothetical protein CLUG_04914 [Clavispora lusitaniae ATCC 42720]|uniref:Uncharacterized protein n=1 Tax=Clavispora lusitaniae (strain ATCC 42720) TaxID=306902 RepID=C4Y9M4_CLAL4|nr:uncharacterized protein CLUG_04914 [Clavispora lusitaniae ATCC 42720]EEQ40785.1 hypothetical protein CLUG_04914 [Clavispora lusitaniae ATCC 42720]
MMATSRSTARVSASKPRRKGPTTGGAVFSSPEEACAPRPARESNVRRWSSAAGTPNMEQAKRLAATATTRVGTERKKRSYKDNSQKKRPTAATAETVRCGSSAWAGREYLQGVSWSSTPESAMAICKQSSKDGCESSHSSVDKMWNSICKNISSS